MPDAPNATKLAYIDGGIDLGTDTIKIALYDDSISYTFDPNTDAHVDDILDGVNAAEMDGPGYARKTLANQSTTQDDTNDQSVFDGDDVTWTDLDAGTIQGVVVFQEVTDDTDSRVLVVLDDTELSSLPLATNGSDVVLTWHADGIQTLGVSA